MPAQRFKPLTNLPLMGTLTAAYYQPEHPGPDGTPFKAQVKLRGTWTGQTDKGPQRNAQGDLYLPDFLANDMCKDGILVDAGTDATGSPLFTVGIAAIIIERTEQGQKRKTTIRTQDGAVKDPYGPVTQPKPASMSKSLGTPAPVPTTVKRMDAGPGMPDAPYTVAGGKKGLEASHPNDGDTLWAELEARYIRCARMAEQTWALANLPPESVVAAAATLFIEANRRNLPGVPAVAPKVGEDFEVIPESLVPYDPDEDAPF